MAFIEWLNERARHIPSQTDTVVRFAPEYVALVLRLCNSVNIGDTSFLLITAFLWGWEHVARFVFARL